MTHEPSPRHIFVTPEQMKELLERLSVRSLVDRDFEILQAVIETVLFLKGLSQEKSITIKRLLRMMFGAATESLKNVLGSGAAQATAPKKEKKKRKGHGRKGASSYPGARKVTVPHDSLKHGDRCPGCHKGKVYDSNTPGLLIRFTASIPVQATVFELGKLRCALCGETFTATVPEEAGPAKYDETVGSMIAVLKYGFGMPFNRIQTLQQNLGVPLPASTQWEIVDTLAQQVLPVQEELIRQAAQGEIIHNDDTTMKILAALNLEDQQSVFEEEDEEETPERSRTGCFTSGFVSQVEGRRIALFFTGNHHAGENMASLLEKREAERAPPIQMCDALSRNVPKSFQTVLSNCLNHARRNFVDVAENFPDECRFVIETLAGVYRNDDIAAQRGMSPRQRLDFHQNQSGQLMDSLKQWLHEQFDQKKVEPNSGLGKAIAYMLRHWDPLTLFLRVENAPLHNNVCERALKKAVLHRRNSLFYKTAHGASTGDVFMSLIHTCNLNCANPFEYLTALQLNRTVATTHPDLWMPWNYRSTLPPASA